MLRTVAIHAPRSSRGGIGGGGKSAAIAGASSREKIRQRSGRAIRYDAQESRKGDVFLRGTIRMNEAVAQGGVPCNNRLGSRFGQRLQLRISVVSLLA